MAQSLYILGWSQIYVLAQLPSCHQSKPHRRGLLLAQLRQGIWMAVHRYQYRQLLLHLNMAEGGFATNRSLWVTQMDNFNQIFLSVIYKKLGLNISRGNEFSSLSSTLLRRQFPNMSAVFERCHNARLINPVPHAYSRLLGTFSRDIKPRERDKLCKELKIAYQEFVIKT